jgi:hypothetical protein
MVPSPASSRHTTFFFSVPKLLGFMNELVGGLDRLRGEKNARIGDAIRAADGPIIRRMEGEGLTAEPGIGASDIRLFGREGCPRLATGRLAVGKEGGRNNFSRYAGEVCLAGLIIGAAFIPKRLAVIASASLANSASNSATAGDSRTSSALLFTFVECRTNAPKSIAIASACILMLARYAFSRSSS